MKQACQFEVTTPFGTKYIIAEGQRVSVTVPDEEYAAMEECRRCGQPWIVHLRPLNCSGPEIDLELLRS